MTRGATPFAVRLHELREQAGLSQYALAKKSGLTKQAVSRLELGEREPSWQTVQLLALALGVSCDQFKDEGLTIPSGEAAVTRKVGRPRKDVEGDAEPAGQTKKPAAAQAELNPEQKPTRKRNKQE